MRDLKDFNASSLRSTYTYTYRLALRVRRDGELRHPRVAASPERDPRAGREDRPSSARDPLREAGGDPDADRPWGFEDYVLASAPDFVRSTAEAEEDLREGRTRPAEKVFAEIKAGEDAVRRQPPGPAWGDVRRPRPRSRNASEPEPLAGPLCASRRGRFVGVAPGLDYARSLSATRCRAACRDTPRARPRSGSTTCRVRGLP